MPPIVVTYCPGEGDCEGKFLQLVLDGVEHLVFAPSSRHGYHNQILERFLDEQGIPAQWDGQSLRVDHPGLQVVGGGRFRLRWADRALECWDHSQAYGPFDRPRLREQLRAAGEPWSALALLLR